MARAYSPEERQEAVRLARELGTAEAARRTGMSARTITKYRAEKRENEPPTTDTSDDPTKLPTSWAEVREREAIQAGALAMRIRQQVVRELSRLQGRDVKELLIAYGIAIDKAEVLTGGAAPDSVGGSWADDELDREYRKVVEEFKRRAK